MLLLSIQLTVFPSLLHCVSKDGPFISWSITIISHTSFSLFSSPSNAQNRLDIFEQGLIHSLALKKQKQKPKTKAKTGTKTQKQNPTNKQTKKPHDSIKTKPDSVLLFSKTTNFLNSNL